MPRSDRLIIITEDAQSLQLKPQRSFASYTVGFANYFNGFLVSKETVVLRRWERAKQKFGFIKRVAKGWITTVKDLESWRFER